MTKTDDTHFEYIFSSSHNRHFLTKGEQRDQAKRSASFMVYGQVARNQIYVARNV